MRLSLVLCVSLGDFCGPEPKLLVSLLLLLLLWLCTGVLLMVLMMMVLLLLLQAPLLMLHVLANNGRAYQLGLWSLPALEQQLLFPTGEHLKQ
jgi:hypothetical protein